MTPAAAVSVLVDQGVPKGLAHEALAPYGIDCDITASDLSAAARWARAVMEQTARNGDA